MISQINFNSLPGDSHTPQYDGKGKEEEEREKWRGRERQRESAHYD